MDFLVAVLPYELRHAKNLADVKIEDLYIPGDHRIPDEMKMVGDLREEDHLIVYCCSSTLLQSYKRLRCKISLMIAEPISVQFRYYILSLLFYRKFYKVLTFSRLLLRLLPNALFHIGVEKTVVPAIHSQKKLLLSIIASKKNSLPGHRLRHAFIAMFHNNRAPIDVFGRGYNEIERKELGLSDYMFSVVIENSRQVNYFTEKIVDCFLQRTVPIYWGAPNISDFFDINGIIICDSLNSLVSECGEISRERYEMLIPAIQANYDIATTFPSAVAGAALKVRLAWKFNVI